MADSASASTSEPPAAEEGGAPPGFEGVAPGTHAVDEAELAQLNAAVATSARVTAEGEDVDAPDLSLKSGVLVEEEEASEIKTVLAPSATPYASAKTFEELNLSPELLTVRSPAAAQQP
jgi:hypothetical protein